MKIHLAIGGLVIGVSLFLHVSKIDFAILLILISLVLVSELLNTSIEILLDMISQEYRKDIKHVKDIQAGAVFIFSIFSAIIGFLIFWPYIYKLFFR